MAIWRIPPQPHQASRYKTAQIARVTVGAGAVSISSTLAKSTKRGLSGVVTITASVVKNTKLVLSGSVTISSTLVSFAKKVLSGEISPISALNLCTSKVMGNGSVSIASVLAPIAIFSAIVGDGIVTIAGNLAKMTSKFLAGVLETLGDLNAHYVGTLYYQDAGDGELLPVGTLIKMISITVANGSIAIAGDLVRMTSKYLSGVVGASPETLYESYTTEETYVPTNSMTWNAETFTPSVSHNISKVKLKMWRNQNPSSIGDLTISIRETSGGLPTGSDLCADTIAANDITYGGGGAWYTFTFDTSVLLLAGTKYAIVVEAEGSAGSDFIAILCDNSGTYAGDGCKSTNGTAWSLWEAPTKDFVFEEYGVVQGMYGALVKQTSKGMGDANLAIEGILTKMAQLAMGAGSIAISGVLSRMTSIFPSGAISSITGALSKLTTPSTVMGSGEVTMAGSIAKMTQKAFDGAVAMVGYLSRATSKYFSGGVTPTGALSKSSWKAVGSGTVTLAGSLVKQISIYVGSGAITIAGSLLAVIVRVLHFVFLFKHYRKVTLDFKTYRSVSLQTKPYRNIDLDMRGG